VSRSELGADVVGVASVPGTLEVRLREFPTSGYVWELVDCPAALVLLERLAESREAAKALVGGERVRRFRFRVARGGEHVLGFALKRAWETAPLRALHVRVQVAGP